MPLVNAQSPILTQQAGPNTDFPATYRTAINVTAVSGVAAEIRGSASTTVYITKIGVTTSASATITVDKRSANSSGGTSTPLTVTPLDTNNAAGTATGVEYTAAPTPGALVGGIAAAIGTSASYSFEAQPITLNAAAQTVSISVDTGVDVAGFVEWYEV